MLYVTKDSEVINSIIQAGIHQACLIIIDDEESKYSNLLSYPNAFMGSILLPPYTALDYMINGNINEYEYQYSLYLDSREPTDFICMLFAATILRGTNIIFYCGNEDAGYFDTFSRYIMSKYGINIPMLTNVNEFAFCVQNNHTFSFIVEPPLAINAIVANLFIYGYMSTEDLYKEYTIDTSRNILLPPEIVSILYNKYRPFIGHGNATFAEVSDYYNNIFESSKKAGKLLKNPLCEV